MSCCGKSRTAEHFRYPSVTQPVNLNPNEDGATQLLRYTRGLAILVRGPRTGRSYAFSADAPEQLVAPADVEVLLRTGLFLRVS
jgi:hypothetical protein